MFKKIYFLYIFIFFLLSSILYFTFISKYVDAYGWATFDMAYAKVITKTGILKKMIAEDCKVDLEKDSDEKIVLGARDFVYRTTVRGKTPTEISNPYLRYKVAHSNPPLKQLCGGCTLELSFILNTLGIKNREVEIIAPSFFKGRKGDAHAVLEVFVKNKWVLMDPTFNCHYDCTDGKKMLSLQEINTCLKSGNSLSPQEGPSKIPGYALSEYYMKFEDFIYAYRIMDADGKWPKFKLFPKVELNSE